MIKSARETDLRTEWYSPVIERGRDDLAAWERAQPENYYETDRHLRAILECYWGAARLRRHTAQLSEFGGNAATLVDLDG